MGGVDRRSIPHVAALDGLRGAAVAAVLLFHGGHLTGGYLGVDLFFVLSGFLITSLLLAESTGSGRIALGGFWARRARRLLPALGGLLVGVALYCVVYAQPEELNAIRADALATIGYVANWRSIFAGSDYWALFRSPSPLEHTWSLAIEEQFYLVWPLVFVGLLAWWKRGIAKAVLVTSLVLGALSATATFLLYSATDPSRAYYGTDTRAAAVLAGAALAAALAVRGPTRTRATRVALEVVGIAAVITLGVAWVSLDGESARLYQGGFLVCGIAGALVIAAAADPRPGPVAKVFSFRPLCWLGLISYGVYLWHWLVDVTVTADRTGISGWSLFFVQCAITLTIAVLSYFLLEMPIRRGAFSIRSWVVLAPVAATAIVVLVVASTAASPSPSDAALAARSDVGGRAVRASQLAPAGAERVLVLGNSVGWYIGDALVRLQASPAITTLNGAYPSCVFPNGARALRVRGETGWVTRQPVFRCDRGWARAISTFRPDLILFVTGEPGTVRYNYGGHWFAACDAEYRDLYTRRLTAAVRRFADSGAQVAITTTPYNFLTYEGRGGTDCHNRVREQVADATGATLVDLFRWVCPEAPACRAEEGGVTLRPDGIHFQDRGATLAARWIVDQARAQRRAG